MNRMTLLTIAFALVLGSTLANPAELVEEVTFANEDITLAGTLTLPEGPGPHPAVVLIHGSGPNPRDQDVFGFRMFEVLADYLAREGVASLRYDKRGVGESTGDFATATSADFADDAEADFRYLLERPEIDLLRVGLLGHSEGGMIAPMIAARNDEVAFVISMAGPVAPPLEGLVTQQERLMEAAGADEETTEREVAQTRRMLELTLQEDWEALEALLRDVIAQQLQMMPEAQREALGDVDGLVADIMVQYRFWYRFFLQHDTAADWERVSVPVLAFFGELDSHTDVAEHRPALEAALAANEDVTVVVLPTANHLFQAAVIACMSEAYGWRARVRHAGPELRARFARNHERLAAGEGGRSGRLSSGIRWQRRML